MRAFNTAQPVYHAPSDEVYRKIGRLSISSSGILSWLRITLALAHFSLARRDRRRGQGRQRPSLGEGLGDIPKHDGAVWSYLLPLAAKYPSRLLTQVSQSLLECLVLSKQP